MMKSRFQALYRTTSFRTWRQTLQPKVGRRINLRSPSSIRAPAIRSIATIRHIWSPAVTLSNDDDWCFAEMSGSRTTLSNRSVAVSGRATWRDNLQRKWRQMTRDLKRYGVAIAPARTLHPSLLPLAALELTGRELMGVMQAQLIHVDSFVMWIHEFVAYVADASKEQRGIGAPSC
ncbi:hypothetical protein CBOM_07736 [Ceraceosorus bombacis]|uniref:Uncharacterized protein n=1 Tax=Ceraceosorus bombacis TaxID=401625 RepID=A0A0P1BI60_9BASI|nr:hypothetical protein CBOM_07736 [Ceraceosorus bombacis]